MIKNRVVFSSVIFCFVIAILGNGSVHAEGESAKELLEADYMAAAFAVLNSQGIRAKPRDGLEAIILSLKAGMSLKLASDKKAILAAALAHAFFLGQDDVMEAKRYAKQAIALNSNNEAAQFADLVISLVTLDVSDSFDSQIELLEKFHKEHPLYFSDDQRYKNYLQYHSMLASFYMGRAEKTKSRKDSTKAKEELLIAKRLGETVQGNLPEGIDTLIYDVDARIKRK